MKTGEQTVAIAFDLNFRHAAEIFSGASDYIAEAHLDWQLMPLNFGFETRLMELARSGQLAGALGTFVSDGWVQGLLATGVPAINMFNFSKITVVPTVSPDDYATGHAAAAHLHTQGAQRFAFFGADGVYYTRLREAGFRAGLTEYAARSAAKKASRTASELHILRPGPSLPEQVEALKDVPELIGIFCSNDLSARELITLARHKGLRCGKDILVVGVDNDPSESIFAGIGISSFKQPIRETGYQSARALHATMQHGSAPLDLELKLPNQVIPRESSLASNRARIGQLAANYIRENLALPELDAASIAQQVGVSRRSLELATKEQFNTSPYQMLAQARLRLAQQLLRSTRLPIMEVGIRCGYLSAYHFSAWFKKQCGVSPKGFREGRGIEGGSGGAL
ncbi:substrate-binding domain-containing protein [Coraliomargarita algicola]|uniref:Substrate-binding domain-containing protein n=1 Tax=Coraliomargarita algicola TaxID=3092156 RepID=A0ABZ0RIW0_9BACT|nr:substrate-binding domain-containing protein [Coraliomargarita sp. J2-16]WPJ94730.1 substrate-binding domain-containing protein [Coraliomargarita sp. J2-16]